MLRQNEEDTLPLVPPPQAISSASSAAAKTLGSTGVTPVVLTPTGSSTPVREAWRDLDKFYASDNDKKDSEGSSEEESENWEENDAHDSEETQDDAADYESSEEDEQEESSAKIQQ